MGNAERNITMPCDRSGRAFWHLISRTTQIGTFGRQQRMATGLSRNINRCSISTGLPVAPIAGANIVLSV